MKNITKNNKQNNLISKIKQFFSTNGWEPLPYQIETWKAFLNGDSGITYPFLVIFTFSTLFFFKKKIKT